MPRVKTATFNVVLVVVRDGDRFLMVQEAHPRGPGLWYLPAGGVEAGEDLLSAAHREVLEEAGAKVRLTGLFRIEHILWRGHNGEPFARWRHVFTAEPLPGTTLKTEPDAESLGAAWHTLDDVARLPLRHQEVVDLIAESMNAPALPVSAYHAFQSSAR